MKNTVKSIIAAIAICAASLVHANTTEYETSVITAGEPATTYGVVELSYQTDGNLVVYKNTAGGKRVVWDARVSNPSCTTFGACQFRFTQGVGAVLYANGVEYWRANLRDPARANKLVISEVAPYFSIRSIENHIVWTGKSRLNWFGGLDNIRYNNQSFYGIERPGLTDFDSLFSNIGHWRNTADGTDVFKFYAQPFAYYNHLQPTEQAKLRTAIQFLKQHKIAMGVEMGVVERTPTELNICGRNIEGVSGVGFSKIVADNVKLAGGTIDFISMDEPYYYSRFLASTAHGLKTNKPCGYTNADLAITVSNSFKKVREVFPSVVLGDIEPYYLLTNEAIQDYILFIDRLETNNAAQLGFIHDDVTTLNADWQEKMYLLWIATEQRKIPYGMIWNGNLDVPLVDSRVSSYLPSTRWVAQAIGKVRHYYSIDVPRGIHNVTQSWNNYPLIAGPETSQESLSYISSYIYAKEQKVESEYSSLAVNRFHHSSLMHSYTRSTYFAPDFKYEGPAFRIAEQGAPVSLELKLCKVVSTGRHFVSSAPNCEVSGTIQVTVLGAVSQVKDKNSAEPLYRCRHLTTGSYLATINPQECTNLKEWFIDGVIGFVN
jgi:hypothetical protein